jgi:ribA/ribD-fused uncharacterized protein
MAIADILLKDGGAAEELQELFDSIKANRKHPLRNNYVIQTLIHETNGPVNNMKLKNRDNKVYDQNQVIYGFAELRNYLNGENKSDVYKRLVAMSILQSGVSTSPISFTQLLPYEDFKEEYNKILAKLNTISNLEDFYNLGVFQRNNWNDDDLVPYSRAGIATVPDYIYGTRKVYNPAMEFLPKSVKEAITNGSIPRVVTFSTLSSESRSEYVVYSWEKSEAEILTEKEMELPYKKRVQLLKEKKLAMKKKGDFSYIQKGLFQRVKESDQQNADPLIHSYTNSKGELKEYYVYKMINAWGNSFSANEFYTVGKASVIDNRFLKAKEVSDGPVIDAFLEQGKTKTTVTRKGSTVTRTISKAPTQPSTGVVSGPGSETKINIYASTGENAELSNFAIRPFKHLDINFDSVEQAFQYYKTEFSPKNEHNRAVASVIKNTKDGKRLRELGREFKGLDQKVWDSMSPTIMKALLKDSFQQNPEALQKLLATGNATLTHTQDKGRWGKEFPRLLMEVRDELRPTQTAGEIKPKGKPAIKDRNQNNCG